jgi:REP element-mobilizing transposase RayT
VPRLPRAEFEAGLYHIFARGNRKQPIYVNDRDRRRYLALLAGVVKRMRWRCLAYCLMDNHMHLVIETRVPNLGRGMQRLHGTYAQSFNHNHGLVGHLFQDRFRWVHIRTDAQLWMTAAYVASNPVAAGLCRSATDWPWSSHRHVAQRSCPEWLDDAHLLSYFAPQGGDPHARYVAFVDAYSKIKGQSL